VIALALSLLNMCKAVALCILAFVPQCAFLDNPKNPQDEPHHNDSYQRNPDLPESNGNPDGSRCPDGGSTGQTSHHFIVRILNDCPSAVVCLYFSETIGGAKHFGR